MFNYIILLDLFILILVKQAFGNNSLKKNLPKCVVDENSVCVLENIKEIQNNDYCIDENDEIYEIVGTIKNKYGICIPLDFDESIKIENIQKRTYENVEYGSDDGSENECKIIIGKDKSSNCVAGYYIGTLSDNIVNLVTDNTMSNLYKCIDDKNCYSVSNEEFKKGYYNYAGESNKYIKCYSNDNCVAIDVIETTIGCNEKSGESNKFKIGDIIKKEDNIMICLSISVAEGVILDLTDENPVSYFIDVSTPDIVYGQLVDHYVIIDIFKGNALLSNKLIKDIPKFMYTGNKSKIEKRGSSDLCRSSSTIIEYELDESERDHNYYRKLN